jgi:hypothetical protein
MHEDVMYSGIPLASFWDESSKQNFHPICRYCVTASVICCKTQHHDFVVLSLLMQKGLLRFRKEEWIAGKVVTAPFLFQFLSTCFKNCEKGTELYEKDDR